MNLIEIDLNLLLVLSTVLEEKSATRAAARLHVTQSAVSNALIRLRRIFDDPLVVRAGRGLVPTPRAQGLAPQLEGALRQLQLVVEAERSFEPATSSRRFTIACADAVALVLLPELSARFEERLPFASLRVVTIEHMIATNGLASGEIDLLIGIPPTIAPGCSAESVYIDAMTCVVRSDHPTIRGRTLTAAQYASHPHVEVAMFGTPDHRVDDALARLGLNRRIVVAAPHFSAVPLIVARTNTIATLSRLVAEALTSTRTASLRLLRPPVKLPALEVRQVWHVRAAADEGTRFLRKLVREAARTRMGHGSPRPPRRSAR